MGPEVQVNPSGLGDDSFFPSQSGFCAEPLAQWRSRYPGLQASELSSSNRSDDIPHIPNFVSHVEVW